MFDGNVIENLYTLTEHFPPNRWKEFVLHKHRMWTTCNPEGDDPKLYELERQVFIARLSSIGKRLI